MKNVFFTLVFTLFFITIYAQTPQAVCYQGAATDLQGNELVSQNISLQISILSGNINGTIEWVERHTTTTDEFGLFSINIGQGVGLGGQQPTFSDIDWKSGAYFLRVEMDVNGGTNYDLMGTSQMISVPYALHAGTAENADTAENAVHAQTADNATTADHASFADTANVANTALVAVSLIGNNDNDPTNEIQTIMQDGNMLTISGGEGGTGNSIELNVDDADADPMNEIQTIMQDGNMLTISGGAGGNGGTGNSIELNVDDADADPTNEMQTLEQVGNMLTISGNGGNSIELNVEDGDADSNNEIQSLEVENGMLSLSGSNSIDLYNALPFGGPGASADFPQGILGEHLVLKDEDYQVPAGKTFYVTAGTNALVINGLGSSSGYQHPTTPNMPVFPENTTISECWCTGILVDNNNFIEAVVIDFFSTSSYVVPAGKVLFVKSGLDNTLPGWLDVNNERFEFFRPNFTRGTRIISFPEFTVLKRDEDVSQMVLTGYLINQDLMENRP